VFRPTTVSVADSLISAVANLHHATLVHKDPELEVLRGQIELLSLPFKAAGRRHEWLSNRNFGGFKVYCSNVSGPRYHR